MGCGAAVVIPGDDWGWTLAGFGAGVSGAPLLVVAIAERIVFEVLVIASLFVIGF